jgi:hypothetical protein
MKRHLLVFAALLLSLGVMADGGDQTVKVNGATVDKTVTQITFSGDDVILHYSDNSSETQDMATPVSIAFELAATAIDKLEVNAPRSNKVFNLRGQYMGNNLQAVPAGVYIVNGKKVIVK